MLNHNIRKKIIDTLAYINYCDKVDKNYRESVTKYLDKKIPKYQKYFHSTDRNIYGFGPTNYIGDNFLKKANKYQVPRKLYDLAQNNHFSNGKYNKKYTLQRKFGYGLKQPSNIYYDGGACSKEDISNIGSIFDWVQFLVECDQDGSVHTKFYINCNPESIHYGKVTTEVTCEDNYRKKCLSISSFEDFLEGVNKWLVLTPDTIEYTDAEEKNHDLHLENLDYEEEYNNEDVNELFGIIGDVYGEKVLTYKILWELYEKAYYDLFINREIDYEGDYIEEGLIVDYLSHIFLYKSDYLRSFGLYYDSVCKKDKTCIFFVI